MDTPERLFCAWPGSQSCVTEVLLEEKTWSYLYNLGLLGGIFSAPPGPLAVSRNGSVGDAADPHQMEATLDKSSLHSRGSRALVSEVSELRDLEQSRSS